MPKSHGLAHFIFLNKENNGYKSIIDVYVLEYLKFLFMFLQKKKEVFFCIFFL